MNLTSRRRSISSKAHCHGRVARLLGCFHGFFIGGALYKDALLLRLRLNACPPPPPHPPPPPPPPPHTHTHTHLTNNPHITTSMLQAALSHVHVQNACTALMKASTGSSVCAHVFSDMTQANGCLALGSLQLQDCSPSHTTDGVTEPRFAPLSYILACTSCSMMPWTQPDRA